MKTLKKLFSVSAIVALLGTLAPMYAFGATYSDELQDAYNYAYAHKITTMNSIENADMYGSLTRVAMAKMIANYATTVLWLEPDTSATCTFTDVTAALDAQYDNWVTKACQLGLMGQNITAFRPNDLVTRAEFGTTLSRALNANSDELASMNAANPYYKEHLNFLNKEGIMKDISNPFMTEVRGYVMLMMMRSDNTYKPVEGCTAEELLACLTAEDFDACTAKCAKQEDNNTNNEVSKSGTLKVTVSENNGAKAIIGGISDLDTINFNASEAGISVDRIVLERYGYSNASGVTVWLEDENGTKVTNEKTINSKDEVSLTIKSAYREMDRTDSLTIVTSIASGTEGSTIWFKVTEVSSSAKTLNFANYQPATYEMVIYDGSEAKFGYKGNSVVYNYTANETYDVARLKVTAPNKNISINGFTLENRGDLSLNRYVDSKNIKVSVDGTNLPATVSINKNDEIEVNLRNAQSIDAKKNTIFVVSLNFDDLDVFGRTVKLEAKEIRWVEDKTNTRLSFTGDTSTAPTYTFNGGQIKLTSTKLGTIDAAAWATEVVFAEWDIELNGQVINMANFTLTASATWIDSIDMLLNGVVIWDATAAWTDFTFKWVTIDKSGKLRFRVNMDSEATGNTITMTPASFNKAQFSGAKYDESNQYVTGNVVIGSISFSTIKVQAAKWALTNNTSKSVEFLTNQTTRQTVFDGEYTAKKWDLYLNEFAIAETNALQAWDTATFYLSIDGRDVASIDLYEGNTWDSMTFSNVKVKKWDKVSVKLVAEVYAANTGNYTYDLTLKGEDMDGTEAGEATAKTVRMNFVDQGGVTISVANADAANTVVLRDNNIKLAKFTVKPSKTEWTTLDSFVFGLVVPNPLDVVVKVDGSEIDSDNITESSNTYTVSWLAETLDNDGVVVEISYRDELPVDSYSLNLTKVNGTNATKTFNKRVADALVTVTKQENLWDTTKFTFGVEKYDDTVNADSLVLSWSARVRNIGDVADGDTFEAENGTTAEFIISIQYDDWTTNHNIDKTTYKDYFKVGSEYLKVFKAKD